MKRFLCFFLLFVVGFCDVSFAYTRTNQTFYDRVSGATEDDFAMLSEGYKYTADRNGVLFYYKYDSSVYRKNDYDGKWYASFVGVQPWYDMMHRRNIRVIITVGGQSRYLIYGIPFKCNYVGYPYVSFVKHGVNVAGDLFSNGYDGMFYSCSGGDSRLNNGKVYFTMLDPVVVDYFSYNSGAETTATGPVLFTPYCMGSEWHTDPTSHYVTEVAV